MEDIKDLQAGMLLEGVVTNVANFGAFVDIGVHQDGLVHISALSKSFVDDPRKVVKAGDVVKVKVVEVDLGRRRIALTMRLDDPLDGSGSPASRRSAGTGGERRSSGGGRREERAGGGAMAEAFARLKRG